MSYQLTGKVFGTLTVIGPSSIKTINGKRQWVCKCLCGTTRLIETNRLLEKRSPLRTCGKCQWHIRHKAAYISWISLRQRCDDPNQKDYSRYGGRGITYDKRWLAFQNFFIDMGDPPIDLTTGERLSLDRMNNDGPYTKENCRWATRSEQQLNKGKKESEKGY